MVLRYTKIILFKYVFIGLEVKGNAVDIKQRVKDFFMDYRGADTLHFHFSGKGYFQTPTELTLFSPRNNN